MKVTNVVSKRKHFVDHPKLSYISTPTWREVVTHFAKKIPMELLIREFNCYYNVLISKGTSNKDFEALIEKGKWKVGQLIHYLDEVMDNILYKIIVIEVLASCSISDDWDAVCAS